jgi:hypothetical protein
MSPFSLTRLSLALALGGLAVHSLRGSAKCSTIHQLYSLTLVSTDDEERAWSLEAQLQTHPDSITIFGYSLTNSSWQLEASNEQ